MQQEMDAMLEEQQKVLSGFNYNFLVAECEDFTHRYIQKKLALLKGRRDHTMEDVDHKILESSPRKSSKTNGPSNDIYPQKRHFEQVRDISSSPYIHREPGSKLTIISSRRPTNTNRLHHDGNNHITISEKETMQMEINLRTIEHPSNRRYDSTGLGFELEEYGGHDMQQTHALVGGHFISSSNPAFKGTISPRDRIGVVPRSRSSTEKRRGQLKSMKRGNANHGDEGSHSTPGQESLLSIHRTDILRCRSATPVHRTQSARRAIHKPQNAHQHSLLPQRTIDAYRSIPRPRKSFDPVKSIAEKQRKRREKKKNAANQAQRAFDPYDPAKNPEYCTGEKRGGKKLSVCHPRKSNLRESPRKERDSSYELNSVVSWEKAEEKLPIRTSLDEEEFTVFDSRTMLPPRSNRLVLETLAPEENETEHGITHSDTDTERVSDPITTDDHETDPERQVDDNALESQLDFANEKESMKINADVTNTEVPDDLEEFLEDEHQQQVDRITDAEAGVDQPGNNSFDIKLRTLKFDENENVLHSARNRYQDHVLSEHDTELDGEGGDDNDFVIDFEENESENNL